MQKTKRLSKRLAELGYCSRREAELLIDKGWVKVNGELITLQGSKVEDSDQIEVTEQGKRYLDKKISIILNKPVGYVCHATDEGYPHVFDLLKNINSEENRQGREFSTKDLAPVGRLDIDSKGLLLLTQDGKIAKAVIGENTKITKSYLVKVNRLLTNKELEILEKGEAWPEKEKLKPLKVRDRGRGLYELELKEGKKRQIRRMVEYLGLEVHMLKRIRIGPIQLGGLEEGKWRYLSDEEKEELLKGARP